MIVSCSFSLNKLFQKYDVFDWLLIALHAIYMSHFLPVLGTTSNPPSLLSNLFRNVVLPPLNPLAREIIQITIRHSRDWSDNDSINIDDLLRLGRSGQWCNLHPHWSSCKNRQNEVWSIHLGCIAKTATFTIKAQGVSIISIICWWNNSY